MIQGALRDIDPTQALYDIRAIECFERNMIVRP
jgi:hypothetical protein